MTRDKNNPPRNLPASVKARLLALARVQGEDFNYILTRYVLERLLYRLSVSRHRDAFRLKGALLFTIWSERPHRATKDIDLLGYGAPDTDRLAAIFGEICDQPVPDDGLLFQAPTIRAVPIREDAVYDGIRITLECGLGTAHIPVQVDVGFGDAVTDPAQQIVLPVLLDFPAPSLKCYRREEVVAEKLHAMVDLGMANSRMKDYFDIWFLSKSFAFTGTDLVAAVTATFERRRTAVPAATPLGLSDAFGADPGKVAQWAAFTRRTRLSNTPSGLPEVVADVAALLLPVVHASGTSAPAPGYWPPGGPWSAGIK